MGIIDSQIYQFKVRLLDTKPPVWRRIQVPADYTFWDLHVAIQDAMGWEDYHLHQFHLANTQNGAKTSIGIPDDDSFGPFGHEQLVDWEQDVADWLTLEQPKAKYWYDFGDDWWHEVILEKILPANSSTAYPQCTAGKRACPPEDCGGPWGYADLIEVIRNPKHKQYSKLIEWLGDSFNPEQFTPQQVVFENPEKRLKDIRENLAGEHLG